MKFTNNLLVDFGLLFRALGEWGWWILVAPLVLAALEIFTELPPMSLDWGSGLLFWLWCCIGLCYLALVSFKVLRTTFLGGAKIVDFRSAFLKFLALFVLMFFLAALVLVLLVFGYSGVTGGPAQIGFYLHNWEILYAWVPISIVIAVFAIVSTLFPAYMFDGDYAIYDSFKRLPKHIFFAVKESAIYLYPLLIAVLMTPMFCIWMLWNYVVPQIEMVGIILGQVASTLVLELFLVWLMFFWIVVSRIYVRSEGGLKTGDLSFPYMEGDLGADIMPIPIQDAE